MRLSVASSTLAAAFVLTRFGPAGYAPALCQDWHPRTRPVEPANRGRRDGDRRSCRHGGTRTPTIPGTRRALDEGGTVESASGDPPLMVRFGRPMWWKARDRARSTRQVSSVFREASVRPFLEGRTEGRYRPFAALRPGSTRHDQPVAAGYTPVVAKSRFHHNERSGQVAYP